MDVVADHLWLRFECFECGRRVIVNPVRTVGWPYGKLLEIQEKMVCAGCGSPVCELLEVCGMPGPDGRIAGHFDHLDEKEKAK